MADIIDPGRLVKLAKLYCVTEQQTCNGHPFEGMPDKQEPNYKINHQSP